MSDGMMQVFFAVVGIGLIILLDVLAYEHGRRDGIREERERKIRWAILGKPSRSMSEAIRREFKKKYSGRLS